jgi:hypothetical protein
MDRVWRRRKQPIRPYVEGKGSRQRQVACSPPASVTSARHQIGAARGAARRGSGVMIAASWSPEAVIGRALYHGYYR